MGKKVDVLKMPIAEVDAMFEDATMSDEEKARDWQLQKLGREFVETHPEYPATDRNADLVDRYVHALGLPLTIKSLELAVERLSADGLLEER